MRHITKATVASTLIGLAVASVPLFSTTHAEATVCNVSPIQRDQAYNRTCTWAKHYVIVNGQTIWGDPAGPGSWSRQKVCYVYVTRYGQNNSHVWVSIA